MPPLRDTKSPLSVDCGQVARRIISDSPQETVRAGEELAQTLLPGDNATIFGDLGSGKTVLIKGLCRGLGVVEEVTSPTFILIHEYSGRVPVYHFDFYRIEKPEEILELGLDEYFNGDGICLVEWADRIIEFLPKKRIEIHLKNYFNKGWENKREILICKL